MAIFYMDDLIIVTNNVTQLTWLKSELKKKFEMSDLGELHYYLVVEFESNKEAQIITIYQMNYIEKVFKHFNMEKCKPLETPFDANSKLLKLLDEEFENVRTKGNERWFIQGHGRISHA